MDRGEPVSGPGILREAIRSAVGPSRDAKSAAANDGSDGGMAFWESKRVALKRNPIATYEHFQKVWKVGTPRQEYLRVKQPEYCRNDY
jgi:hypothetical protein